MRSAADVDACWCSQLNKPGERFRLSLGSVVTTGTLYKRYPTATGLFTLSRKRGLQKIGLVLLACKVTKYNDIYGFFQTFVFLSIAWLEANVCALR